MGQVKADVAICSTFVWVACGMVWRFEVTSIIGSWCQPSWGTPLQQDQSFHQQHLIANVDSMNYFVPRYSIHKCHVDIWRFPMSQSHRRKRFFTERLGLSRSWWFVQPHLQRSAWLGEDSLFLGRCKWHFHAFIGKTRILVGTCCVNPCISPDSIREVTNRGHFWGDIVDIYVDIPTTGLRLTAPNLQMHRLFYRRRISQTCIVVIRCDK